jgi:hypothetical protein
MRLGESVRVLRELPPRQGCDIHEAAGRAAARIPALPAVIGVERGATHLYPVVTMDVTRLQMTNIKPGKMVDRGPMNTFPHLREFPAAGLKVFVRPSFDMLCSAGRLDLTRGPVVVSAPDTSGRYCLLPMIDLWTEVFAVPGKRTSGTVAADFVVGRTLACPVPAWRATRVDVVEVLRRDQSNVQDPAAWRSVLAEPEVVVADDRGVCPRLPADRPRGVPAGGRALDRISLRAGKKAGPSHFSPLCAPHFDLA